MGGRANRRRAGDRRRGTGFVIGDLGLRVGIIIYRDVFREE
jgi:hypothetical protein